MNGALARAAMAEVRARHAFFVEWFCGRAGEAAFAVSARAFAPDMRRIGPDGAMQDRGAVLAMLHRAEGSQGPGFAIEIVPGAVLEIGAGAVLVTYDEAQRIGGRRAVRRATALFTRDDRAPEGVVWRHLHETWIEDGTAPGSGAANMEETT